MRYYANLGLVSVTEIWCEIAATLKLLPRKLRPGDRFGDDVGTYMLTSDELDTLTELGEKRAKWLGIDVQFEKNAIVEIT